MSNNITIVLVGAPLTGKSILARKIAEKYNLTVADEIDYTCLTASYTRGSVFTITDKDYPLSHNNLPENTIIIQITRNEYTNPKDIIIINNLVRHTIYNNSSEAEFIVNGIALVKILIPSDSSYEQNTINDKFDKFPKVIPVYVYENSDSPRSDSSHIDSD